MEKIIVTTADLKADYEIIGPVYFHVSNKGFFTSRLYNLMSKYQAELKDLAVERENSDDWNQRYGEDSFKTENRFDKAFYIGIRELKLSAERLNCNAIIGLRQDIKFDPDNFQYFYLQMYGTAVRLK